MFISLDGFYSFSSVQLAASSTFVFGKLQRAKVGERVGRDGCVVKLDAAAHRGKFENFPGERLTLQQHILLAFICISWLNFTLPTTFFPVSLSVRFVSAMPSLLSCFRVIKM